MEARRRSGTSRASVVRATTRKLSATARPDCSDERRRAARREHFPTRSLTTESRASEIEACGARTQRALLVAGLVVEGVAGGADFFGTQLCTVVAGAGRETEARVHDAALGRHRRAAHVQRAGAMHGDIAGACRQRHAREVEPDDAERRDIGAMRARDGTELAVLG